MQPLDRYRPWFYAAAVYNAIWGAIVVLFPNFFHHLFGLPPLHDIPIFQSVGIMVGVYAIGYWLIARDPVRYGPFVYIGLFGKVFGPIGFLFSALRGELPWAFGWINLTNDVIWLPAFLGFTWTMIQTERRK